MSKLIKNLDLNINFKIKIFINLMITFILVQSMKKSLLILSK